ncbi:bifunctional serine/threonine-protein kinase/ABC transporter substrate-binding protein [Streptomyces sp. NPDC058001]|uniref:bifunctional serine/threonine-protein kinase/ABC transporter substrate-binding protein n=1 Tax=Streptomyces sp. NPDC058001 TaxID=3346300 RepID=UPI0036E41AC9
MTESLLPSDPSSIGGHRLLGRLGAGGMGVVYLARAESGALAAVKVIQSEYAADDEFRARFRREADAARRVSSPWAVPVTGADLDAEQPWMATAFVPGPALNEAVAACGPLPVRSVRVLGKMLAGALGAVHAAGLVHRDVKPGNVLLAVDGPRLIDFGIARSLDDTALTSADLVIGTPGFLSPEQARARGDALGPATDVFSLGCLLAYAATGRPPFGTGAVDALLYRTVHDEPDLAGLDDTADAHGERAGDGGEPSGAASGRQDLAALIRRCLAKDPADRPTAAEVDAALIEDLPSGTAEWLPADVVRMIADRAATMLELPDIEPTLADPQTPPDPPNRRRFLAVASGATVLAVGGGAGLRAALADSPRPKTPAARRWTIGVQADLSGPLKAVGRAQERGARLAVEQFNARKDRPFEVTLKTSDDGGRPERAAAAARKLTGDRDVLAVLGPSDDRTTKAAIDTYDAALLPLITVTCGDSSLFLTGPRTLLRARPIHGDGGARIAWGLLGTAGAGTPGLIQDRRDDSVSWQYAQMVNAMLRYAGRPAHPRVVPVSTRDYRPVVADLLARGVGSVVYCGPPDGAAKVARALAERGFKGPRFADEAVFDAAFPKAAGKAAEGWTVLSAAIGPGAPELRTFAAAHRERFGVAPARWAAESYDAVNFLIQQVVKESDGGKRRPAPKSLVAPLRAARYDGIVKPLAFETKNANRMGNLVGAGMYLYQVTDGAFRYTGRAPAGAPGN